MDRRTAIARIAASALLSGCCSVPPRSITRIADLCKPGQAGPSEDGPLVIDVHCHVFNGTDLQVKDFVGKVVANEFGLDKNLAGLLADLASAVRWLIAPAAKKEQEVLDAVFRAESDTPALSASGRASLEATRATQESEISTEFLRVYRENPSIREHLYQHLRKLLSPSAHKLIPQAERANLIRIRNLLEERGSLSDQDIETLQSLPGPVQIYALVNSMLQYRYANCYAIAEAYSCAGAAVDLFTPALVDFDHWLGGLTQTISPLTEQLVVMEKVMRLMGGNFHAYAPFNPWAHLLDPKYFESIQAAVEKGGFIGIKIYPPMGFAPYGNVDVPDALKPPIWGRLGTPSPEELDRAMRDLYRYSHQSCVPILAHAGPSFGQDPNSDLIGGPQGWRAALAHIRALGPTAAAAASPNVCFGHIGGAYEATENKPRWPAQFAALCKEYENAYGDLSFWDYLLGSPEQFSAAKATLDAMRGAWPEGIFDRLLYGSDWNLLLISEEAPQYAAQFAKALAQCGISDGQIGKIMGPNAASFLSLRKPAATAEKCNRTRLDELYAGSWKVDPYWRKKVDRI